jgi:hypothetical protein
VAQARIESKPGWAAQQKKRLGKRYESYWYTTEKGQWTKREGWPVDAAEWKKLQAWIVRRKMKPDIALRVSFDRELLKMFRELYPLLEFTSIP